MSFEAGDEVVITQHDGTTLNTSVKLVTGYRRPWLARILIFLSRYT